MHRIRSPRVEDAAAIHELIRAYETEVLGAPDMTVQDVADELSEPGFDPDRDGWLAYDDADGRIDATSWAYRNGDSDLVDVEVIVRPGVAGLAERLWPLVLGRARELGAERGHEAVTLHLGIHATDRAKRAMARERGFAPGTSFHRMRIDHEPPVEAPVAPARVTLHTGERDEVRREAHLVHQRGFAAHFGFVPVDYDLWYARRQAHRATDWSQLTLARLDGRPAGVVIGSNQFLPDEDCGYVATLAVLPEFRGAGLGRFLLRHAFAADAARGRRGTILHVDAENTTPALGLYESSGMRRVMAIEVWRRRL
ncbi:GNAT family N-acetyltransferase [Micromonospora sp. NPDC049559]|uniref:GNAT family N-acetyltransferase n=1 Tax=Micromonospora sp. NPDC049559 TaxID=3155923 RepID=UPI00341F6050